MDIDQLRVIKDMALTTVGQTVQKCAKELEGPREFRKTVNTMFGVLGGIDKVYSRAVFDSIELGILLSQLSVLKQTIVGPNEDIDVDNLSVHSDLSVGSCYSEDLSDLEAEAGSDDKPSALGADSDEKHANFKKSRQSVYAKNVVAKKLNAEEKWKKHFEPVLKHLTPSTTHRRNKYDKLCVIVNDDQKACFLGQLNILYSAIKDLRTATRNVEVASNILVKADCRAKRAAKRARNVKKAKTVRKACCQGAPNYPPALRVPSDFLARVDAEIAADAISEG